MKKLLKYILPALILASSIGVALAQVSTPPIVKKVGNNILPLSTSTTLGSSTVNGSFNNLNIAGTCTGSGCGSSGTSTLTYPLNLPGNATGTFTFNTKVQFPSPTALAAGATCGVSYPDYDAGQCHNDIYTAAPSSTEIDYGSYRYNHSVPVISNINGKYILDKGVPGGGTYFSFTPSYFTITAVNTSTKVITYATTTALDTFTGEPVTYVGPVSTLGVGTLYYVGQLSTSTHTFVLYKNAGLTTTSTLTTAAAVGGTLSTPAFTYDIGNSKHEGWGVDGIYLNGPSNGSSTGFYFGGTQGAEGVVLKNSHVKGFYYNIYQGDNVYFFTIDQTISDFNAPNITGGGLLFDDGTSNGDEEMRLINSTFADAEPNNSAAAISWAVHLQTSGFADWECSGVAFDDAGVYLDWYDGQNNSFHAVNCRWENPGSAGGGWVSYVPITTNAGNPNTSVDIGLTNAQFLNDGNGGGNAWTTMMSVGPNVKVNLFDVSADANTYIGATTVTDFMTLGSGSTVSSQGFANQGDVPGVTYLYGTRVPVSGFMTNAPSFLDSTLALTGNFTYYNGFIGNPTVSAVSSTLQAYSPNYQVCNGTATVNYAMPAIVNNTGLDFDFVDRGTANCTLTANGSDFFWYNKATSTTMTLTPGQGIRVIDDATYWSPIGGLNNELTAANTWTQPQTFNTQYYSAFASSTASVSTTAINWNNSNVQEIKLTTSTTLTFSNVNTGGRYLLMLLQDSTGSRTVTWPSTVQWAAGTAPTLTTTASKMDIVSLVCAGVSSTDCYGGANLNYSP